MNNLTIFNNIEFGKVRAIEIDGRAYAVGVDVAKALEYANPSKAVIDHCKGITKLGIPSSGGIQETNIIPESDIYRLIIKAADQSRSPDVREKAARFEKWLFEEALPSIRKRGAYITRSKAEALLNDPGTWAELLMAVQKDQEEKKLLLEKNERLQAKVESDKPKIVFADAVSVSQGAISVADLAKILKGNGLEIGQKRLFQRLREDGFLIRREGSDRNSPTQKSMQLGLFRIKETAITRSDGRITISKTSKITGRGQCYFIDYFLNKKGFSHAD